MARQTAPTRREAPHRARARSRAVAALAILFLLAGALALAGCGRTVAPVRTAAEKPSASSATNGFPVTITDDTSRTVTIESRPERIVSLAPANTEILFALGLGEKVVGVTTYCDYPAEVKDKPKIGDFVSPNLEAIAAARPDLVLATGGVQADVIAKLEGLGAKVVVFDPQSVEEVRRAIRTTGRITGATDTALHVDGELQSVIEEVVGAVPQGARRASAFIEIGQNPLFTSGGGTILDDMVRIAYGSNVVTQPGYVAYSLEQLVKQDPEVYLATKGTMSDPAEVGKRPGYNALDAVKNGRVYVLDDNLVTRPGPRIGQGLMSIAKALHPDWYTD